MFRGFRWQLLTFLLAVVVFSVSLVFRIGRQTAIPAPEPPAATATTQITIPTAAPTVTIVNSAEPDALPEPLVFGGFREGLVGSVQRLNPLFAHLNAVDRDIASLIFEGLFATNDYGAPVPRLAEDLVISSDGLEYVVQLRADIRWQDSIPFTADDVAYTMSLLSDLAYAGYSSAAQFWQTVETQVLGEHLVRFRLAQPLASFPSLLTIGLLPEHALRGTSMAQLASHPFNLSPIGTGPYQVAALHSDNSGSIQSVHLQFSPLFRQRLDSPTQYQIEALRFDLFSSLAEALDSYRAGRLDALANVANRSQLLTLPNARLYTQLESAVKVLIFNWDREFFQDRRLRQALALAIDIPANIEQHLADSAIFADSPLVPGSAAYQPNNFWVTQDMARAATLFAGAFDPPAGDADGSGETTEDGDEAAIQIRLLVEDIAPIPDLAEDIAKGWRELSLQVSVDAVSQGEFSERLRAGDFDAAIVMQHIGSDPDLYRYWHPAQAESGLNYGSANSDVISELMEVMRQERNGVVRQSLLESFQEQFAEETIALPLYYPLYSMAVSDKFEGIRLGYLGTAADRYRGIEDWRLLTSTG